MYTGQFATISNRATWASPTCELVDDQNGTTTDLTDPALTVEIMDLLCDVNARGTTVIVATHDASLIERYQKRTLRLEHGTVVADARGARAARLMAQLA